MARTGEALVGRAVLQRKAHLLQQWLGVIWLAVGTLGIAGKAHSAVSDQVCDHRQQSAKIEATD